jgi:hypothetical protein
LRSSWTILRTKFVFFFVKNWLFLCGNSDSGDSGDSGDNADVDSGDNSADRVDSGDRLKHEVIEWPKDTRYLFLWCTLICRSIELINSLAESSEGLSLPSITTELSPLSLLNLRIAPDSLSIELCAAVPFNKDM